MPADRSKQRPRNAKRRSARKPRRPASPPAGDLHEYSARDLKRLFDLSAALLQSLTEQGFIRPEPSEAGNRYSFQDLLVLRTAGALRAAKIPSRKIIQALARLRESLPGSGFSALAVAPAGGDIAVREGRHLWQFESGQYALPLAVSAPAPAVTPLKPADPAPQLAEAHFAQGFDLEDTDPAGAQAAYRACLELSPEHVEARINLGRLLHLDGELKAAERVYRGAPHPNALVHFNLAVVLEDLHREGEAIEHYRHAIALDPTLSDAHYNLARLHERAHQPRDALRHLLAYKRLTDPVN